MRITRKRRHAIACTTAVLALGAAAGSAQAVVIGQTAPPGETTSGCVSAVQERVAAGSPTYTIPFDGELTSWSHRTKAAVQPVQLQVWRQTRFTFPPAWLVVAQSRLETPVPNALNTFRTSIRVTAGDVLALRGAGEQGVLQCYFLSRVSDDDVQTFADAFSPGETAVEDGPGVSATRLNVSATVEDVCRNKHGKRKKPSWCARR